MGAASIGQAWSLKSEQVSAFVDICAQVIYSVDLCWIKLESFMLRILRVIFGLGRSVFWRCSTLSASRRTDLKSTLLPMFGPVAGTSCGLARKAGVEAWAPP